MACLSVVVILGTSIPLLVLDMSNMELAFAGTPDEFMATVCEKVFKEIMAIIASNNIFFIQIFL